MTPASDYLDHVAAHPLPGDYPGPERRKHRRLEPNPDLPVLRERVEMLKARDDAATNGARIRSLVALVNRLEMLEEYDRRRAAGWAPESALDWERAS